MLEIERLDTMLKEAGIPFERDDEDLRPKGMKYWMCRIAYPKTEIINNERYKVCSVIQGTGSYGGKENLLEIMGLLTPEEEEHDSVCGHLSAEDVFERIKQHWERSKGNG